MAISEACQLWIEQRIEEELEDNTASQDIGITIAQEYTAKHILPFIYYLEERTGLQPYYTKAIINHAISPCQLIKSRPTEGFIYYFKSRHLIKIGFATDVTTRLKTIQNMSSVPVTCLGYHKGTIADEMEIHKRFTVYRKHGEWFACSDEIMQFIFEKAKGM